MAREMGHYVLRHVLINCLLLALTYAVTFFLMDRLGNGIISRLGNRLGFQRLSDLGVVPLLLLFVAIFQFLSATLVNLAIRHTEHEADRVALEMTRNNHASALSFVKLQQENLGTEAGQTGAGSHRLARREIFLATTVVYLADQVGGNFGHPSMSAWMRTDIWSPLEPNGW